MAAKNHLAGEVSPYLLEHSEDPVDWYPWCDAAFEMARKLKKPIFLSIGYSTCHWCHVMHDESFKDPEMARLLNDAFVCIKVDREERPDIDGIYMKVCQMLTGSGGWPLTILITPNKKPFFAGTYIPKEPNYGMPGLKALIAQVNAAIVKDGLDNLEAVGNDIVNNLEEARSKSPVSEVEESALHEAFSLLGDEFDAKNGGFGSAPKFPMPTYMLFLINYWKSKDDKGAMEMVLKTLEVLRNGGIYDQIGFGFFRYSTDAIWLVPHFEKMLYDQALLSLTYLQAYKATKNEELAETAREIFDFAFRELASPDGPFYTAIDADSDGSEGAFYVWDYGELKKTLPIDDANAAAKLFGFKEGGNVGHQHGELEAKNIPFLKNAKLSTAQSKESERVRMLLFEAREKRTKPSVDDKALTDLNGLMILSLAEAHLTLGGDLYLSHAKKAADFIINNMIKGKTLYHSYTKGEVRVKGFIDDYAFFGIGLLRLYEASFEMKYLKTAIELTEIMIEKLWDIKEHAFFFSESNADMIMREKEFRDGVIPSGNSASMRLLYLLERITGEEKYRRFAEDLIGAFGPLVSRNPAAYTYFLSTFNLFTSKSYEIVVAGKKGANDTEELLKAVNSSFVPNKVVLLLAEGLSDIAKFTENMKMIDGKATAYICSGFQCNKPTTDPKEVSRLLKG